MADASITVTVVKRETVTKLRREWKLGAIGQDGWGYVDDQWPQEESHSIFEQTVPAADFDLASLVKAVNKL